MPGVQCGEIEEQGIGYQDERRVQECDSRLGLGTCEIDVAVIRSAGKRLPRGRLRLASTQFLAQARKALDYMQLVRLRLRLFWHSRIFADGEPVDREFGLVIGKLEISSRAVSLLRCLLGNGARDFSLRFIRKLRKDEPIAHTAEVEHETVRQVGVEVDGDSCVRPSNNPAGLHRGIRLAVRGCGRGRISAREDADPRRASSPRAWLRARRRTSCHPPSRPSSPISRGAPCSLWDAKANGRLFSRSPRNAPHFRFETTRPLVMKGGNAASGSSGCGRGSVWP